MPAEDSDRRVDAEGDGFAGLIFFAYLELEALVDGVSGGAGDLAGFSSLLVQGCGIPPLTR